MITACWNKCWLRACSIVTVNHRTVLLDDEYLKRNDYPECNLKEILASNENRLRLGASLIKQLKLLDQERVVLWVKKNNGEKEVKTKRNKPSFSLHTNHTYVLA